MFSSLIGVVEVVVVHVGGDSSDNNTINNFFRLDYKTTGSQDTG